MLVAFEKLMGGDSIDPKDRQLDYARLVRALEAGGVVHVLLKHGGSLHFQTCYVTTDGVGYLCDSLQVR